jgi:hypothetical protein
MAYARAWSHRSRHPGQQHKGPITRAFLEVLEALLWGFHNSRSGCCFPSHERIAEPCPSLFRYPRGCEFSLKNRWD